MKRSPFLAAHLIAACAVIMPSSAELLYEGYLVPPFADNPDTEYSAWDLFYAANLGANYPDFAAPNGILQSATDAGFTPPAGASPADPAAFWHPENPTITQNIPGIAFIIGPAITGNIYSFRGPTDFRLNDETPYDVGTVVFQFQTAGNLVDFGSIKLVYDDNGTEVVLDPDEYIREYQSDTSGFGGSGNRNALQWDLTGRNVDSYRVIWTASGSSMSLQEVSLDTSASYVPVVPEGRTWNGTGSTTWVDSANWEEGSPSQDFGNVRFVNEDDVTISMPSTQTVGEFVFDTARDVTIANSARLISNTGLFTGTASTGTYRIEGDFEMCAYNLFEIDGGEVIIEGQISGTSGLRKEGEGKMVLKADNSFGAGTGGIGCTGGELRIEGANQFTSSASVLRGDLVLAGPAPVDAPGTLGNASSDVTVGANSSIFGGISTPARLIVEGDHEIARGVSFAAGTFDKRLGARGTSAGAEFSGAVALRADSTNTKLFAEDAADLVVFSGEISGGEAALTMEINPDGAQGTVRFSGDDKTYANVTHVRGGLLELAAGTSLSAQVILEPGIGEFAAVGGSGAFTGGVEVGAGGTLEPGSGVGVMASGGQTWGAAGALEIEISDPAAGAGAGWDLLEVEGLVNINASPEDPFLIRLISLEPLAGFPPESPVSWKIVQSSDGIIGFSAEHFVIDTTAFSTGAGDGVFSLGLENGGTEIHLRFTPGEGSPYEAWRENNFSVEDLADDLISGFDADTDSDGLSNLLEYALGGDPNVADAGLLPEVLIDDSSFGDPAGEFLAMTFSRLLDRTDIDYVVEASGSLEGDWVAVMRIPGGGAPVAVNGGGVSVAGVQGNFQEVKAGDLLPVQNSGRRFLRLLVLKR